MHASNSVQVANTPPVTPRENTRLRNPVAVLSPCDGVFTPAKVDDVSRASSLRIPVSKHQSPVVTFRQPVLTDRLCTCAEERRYSQVVTTPPYPKRRKSSSSGSSDVDECQSRCCALPCAEIESGYRTPPRHKIGNSPIGPAAPRKPSRCALLDNSGSDEEDVCFPRRITFGDSSDVSAPLEAPDVDWDAYLSIPFAECPRIIHIFNRGLRALCSSGLEAMGKVPLLSVRGVLKDALGEESGQVVRMLRSNACSDWIVFSPDDMVEFPQRITAAELVARISN